ncbi:MAG: FAD-binding oxidoreductase, partial [Hyphomicrobiales bacterium]|nr:FAD-binding oxidoreductase [Hyphomicrobiales bacterium]
MKSFDVVIAGGAVMGSSTAYHVLADPGFKGSVLVIEKDMTYQRCASALSLASIRQQFSSLVNIRISLYGISFLKRAGEILAVDGERQEIAFHEGGYLYLASEDGRAILTENQALQASEGADILLLDRAGLTQRFHWLNLDGIALGTWGRSGEGWFDGWGLLQAFRRKARRLGAEYREGKVTGVERERDRITAVALEDGSRIACGTFVDCAGASGGREIAALVGAKLPVHQKKRLVFSFICRDEVKDCPLLIDTTGVYARPEGKPTREGQMYLCGASPPPEADPDCDDFEVDFSFFEDFVWPALANRVPAFERIKPGRAYAGHYDLNLLDHNAIVGRLGGTANAYVALGFSGHGMQQSPAVGRGLSELIVHGGFKTLDLSALAPE